MSPICLYTEAIRTFAMFYAHELREKQGIPVLNMHSTLTTFTRFVQNSTIWCVLTLYSRTMHVATLKPYFRHYEFSSTIYG